METIKFRERQKQWVPLASHRHFYSLFHNLTHIYFPDTDNLLIVLFTVNIVKETINISRSCNKTFFFLTKSTNWNNSNYSRQVSPELSMTKLLFCNCEKQKTELFLRGKLNQAPPADLMVSTKSPCCHMEVTQRHQIMQ